MDNPFCDLGPGTFLAIELRHDLQWTDAHDRLMAELLEPGMFYVDEFWIFDHGVRFEFVGVGAGAEFTQAFLYDSLRLIPDG